MTTIKIGFCVFLWQQLAQYLHNLDEKKVLKFVIIHGVGANGVGILFYSYCTLEGWNVNNLQWKLLFWFYDEILKKSKQLRYFFMLLFL